MREEALMGVTVSCDETIIVSLVEHVEPDYADPITNEELTQALESRTRDLRDDERVEADIRGNDAFGI